MNAKTYLSSGLLLLFTLLSYGQSKDEEIQRLTSLVKTYEDRLKKAESIAVRAKFDADRRRYLSIAREVAERSIEVKDLELSCLLALQAYSFNSKYDGYEFDGKIFLALLEALKQRGLVSKQIEGNQQIVTPIESTLTEPQKLALKRILFNYKFKATHVSFSPSGNFVALDCSDSLVRIWNLKALNQRPRAISDLTKVVSISFSPDESLLMVLTNSGNDNNRILNTFQLNASEMATELCKYLKRNLTKEEWELYIAEDLPIERTCINLPFSK